VRVIALPDVTLKVDTHSRMRLALARALFVKVHLMYSPHSFNLGLTDVIQACTSSIGRAVQSQSVLSSLNDYRSCSLLISFQST